MRCPMSRAVGEVKTRELAGSFPTRPTGFGPVTFGSVDRETGVPQDAMALARAVRGSPQTPHCRSD